MAANDPTYCKTHDATAWDADDGSAVTDILTCVTDDDTSTSCAKQGKNPDDIIRIEYPDLLNFVAGVDSVTVHFGNDHNYTVIALLPYDGAISVLTTNKLTYAISSGTPAVFTPDANFLADLHDLGSGKGAVRIVEDGEIDGDLAINECQSDFTGGGADNRRRQVLHRRRR